MSLNLFCFSPLAIIIFCQKELFGARNMQNFTTVTSRLKSVPNEKKKTDGNNITSEQEQKNTLSFLFFFFLAFKNMILN